MSESCDRCGTMTTAAWWVCLQSGGELTMCGHCMKDHHLALDALNAVLIPMTSEVPA